MIPVDDQFPNKDYPKGVEYEYLSHNSFRATSAEMREKELLMESEIRNLRREREELAKEIEAKKAKKAAFGDKKPEVILNFFFKFTGVQE